MEKLIKIQTISTEDSILFGINGNAYVGTSFVNGSYIKQIEGNPINEFEITVKYDGRKKVINLIGDICAGLNALYSSNYTDNEVEIIKSNLPSNYPLEHPNKTDLFKSERQLKWSRLLLNIEHNNSY